MNRRELMVGGAAALATGCNRSEPARPRAKSAVAVVKAATYSTDLVDCMLRGVAQCGLNVKGKRVLLKPNFVEFSTGTAINTNPAVVAAAVEVFEKLGAAQVLIGEGPGHRRDTFGLAEEAGYRSVIKGFENRFTDLNRDDVSRVEDCGSLGSMYFSSTLLSADLVVSLAKMKTHHWAGATLSMKNLFGLVPGSIYGWPKNVLHWNGRVFAIEKSIVALNQTFRRTFAIVDGVIGMEGNGPIQGTPKAAGVLVMGSDVVAVDATCCRIMGINPDKIKYLEMAAELGNSAPVNIEQRGETPESVRTDFQLMDRFRDLRL